MRWHGHIQTQTETDGEWQERHPERESNLADAHNRAGTAEDVAGSNTAD